MVVRVTSNTDDLLKSLEEAKKKGFTSSFIVAIQAGKEISLKEALK